MAGFTLSKSAVTKTARAVRKSEGSPNRIKGQGSRRIGGQQGKSSITVAPAIISSGSNGSYIGNILDDSGGVIEAGATLIPDPATAYDLPADSQVVAYKVSVETLGSGS